MPISHLIETTRAEFDNKMPFGSFHSEEDRERAKELVTEAQLAAYRLGVEDAIKALPETIDVGSGTYCNTCKQHIAAGDCSCCGKNDALTDIHIKLESLLTTLTK